MKKFFYLAFIAFFLQTSLALASATDWHHDQSTGAKTRLLASFYENEKGERKLVGGLHFKIKEGWKVYANGSEEGLGLPPRFDFKDSLNCLEPEVIWPQAEVEEEKIGGKALKVFFYKNEIVIPFKINLEKHDQPAELTLTVNYGICKDVCVPVNESFSLKVTDEIDRKALQKIQPFFPEKIVATADKSEGPMMEMMPSLSLISAIILAIFGGAILNIMPCVLPVLSIKLISVINHSEKENAHIRFASFSTIFGILSCFFIFSSLAAIIKFTGNSLGWGLQFQNPYFLIFLIVILMFFIANLIGIFEINYDQFLATLLNKKIAQSEEQKIFMPNFLSGVLAVLLATPCSAPFLGSAISFALIGSFSNIFLIFFFIGLGFALPYIILIFSPNLIRFLPKPGIWMLKVKQLMAGLLVATVIWLLYILSHNIGAMPAFISGAVAVTILACLKIKSNFTKYLAIAIVIAASFCIPIDMEKRNKAAQAKYDMIWKKFDEMEIYRQIMKGRVVVIDITADWCLTCKFNKIRILQDDEVMMKLKGGDLFAMRGDITKPDEEVMNFMRKHNRFAIPFNIVYGPEAKTGLLASEFLTKEELLELIEKASKK